MLGEKVTWFSDFNSTAYCCRENMYTMAKKACVQFILVETIVVGLCYEVLANKCAWSEMLRPVHLCINAMSIIKTAPKWELAVKQGKSDESKTFHRLRHWNENGISISTELAAWLKRGFASKYFSWYFSCNVTWYSNVLLKMQQDCYHILTRKVLFLKQMFLRCFYLSFISHFTELKQTQLEQKQVLTNICVNGSRFKTNLFLICREHWYDCQNIFGGTIIEILIKEKRNFNKKRKRVKSVVH